MIPRRHFLGALLAFPAGASLFSTVGRGATRKPDGWKCRVIETLPRNDAARFPVVTDLSLQPGGDLLAVVGDDHRVALYDLAADRFQRQLERHSDWVQTTCFRPDGQRLVTAGNDRALLIWKTGEWDRPFKFHTHRGAVFDTAYSPDGQWLAAVGFESILRVYDGQHGVLLQELQCPCDDMRAVTFSRDSRWVAAGGRSGTIRIWDVTTGQVVTDQTVHRRRIRALEFGPGSLLLSAGDDQRIRLGDARDLESGRVLPSAGGKVFAAAFLDDERIVTAGSDNIVRIWRTGDFAEDGRLEGHTGTITCLVRGPQGLFTGSYDTQIRIWQEQAAATARRPGGGDFGLPSPPPATSGWNSRRD